MDPITLSAQALRVGTELSESGSLLIAAGSVVYSLVTTQAEPKPINNYKLNPNYQDRTRYDRLCDLRRPLSEDGKIPEQWVLNENGCPTYKVKFTERARNLKQHVEALDVCSYPQKTAVSGMVEIIENVFVSLSLRKSEWKSVLNHGWFKWKGYRSDSYEVMFFADLAIWLSITLPRYNIKDTDTELLISKWIKYCGEVQTHVLKFRGDNDSANSPKELLSSLILELKQLHENICKANRAATFNEKIEQINVEMVNMAKHAFNFLHLLTENEKNPVIDHSGINVRQFLAHANPTETTKIDPNVSRIVKSVMGGWIAETFRVAGINSCDFTNKLEIDIVLISEHICTNFSKIGKLDVTGLWSFARKDRAKAENYLEKIAEIHRLILKLYYVRTSVLMSASVSRDLGNSWVYGEDTGKEIVNVLLKVIEDASEELNDTIAKFWEDFYTNDYIITHNRSDDTDICFQHMALADTVVKKISAHHASIESKLSEISKKSDEYVEDKKSIEKKIQKLIEGLHAYVMHSKLRSDTSLRLFRSNQSNFSLGGRIFERFQYVTVGDGLTTETTKNLLYEQKDLPLYCKALTIYNERKPVASCDFSLPQNLKSTDFHSKTQRRIYEGYLIPCHKIVTGWEFLSFWNGISYYKIDAFKKLYAFVNEVMKTLYSGDKESWPKISKIEASLIDSILVGTIKEDFDSQKYYSFNLQFQEEPLEAEIVDGRVQVKLKEYWREVATAALAKELHALTEALNQREEFHLTIQRLELVIQELTAERDALATKLAERDQIIAKQDRTIAEKDRTIAEQDTMITSLYTAVTNKDKVIQQAQEKKVGFVWQQRNQVLNASSKPHSFRNATSFGVKLSTHGFTLIGRSSKAKVPGSVLISPELSENDEVSSILSCNP